MKIDRELDPELDLLIQAMYAVQEQNGPNPDMAVRTDPVIPWDELFEAADCVVCDKPLGELDDRGIHSDCEQRVEREYARILQRRGSAPGPLIYHVGVMICPYCKPASDCGNIC
jgi:hypothetical protein